MVNGVIIRHKTKHNQIKRLIFISFNSYSLPPSRKRLGYYQKPSQGLRINCSYLLYLLFPNLNSSCIDLTTLAISDSGITKEILISDEP